jgi:hypothetical protein
MRCRITAKRQFSIHGEQWLYVGMRHAAKVLPSPNCHTGSGSVTCVCGGWLARLGCYEQLQRHAIRLPGAAMVARTSAVGANARPVDRTLCGNLGRRPSTELDDTQARDGRNAGGRPLCRHPRIGPDRKPAARIHASQTRSRGREHHSPNHPMSNQPLSQYSRRSCGGTECGLESLLPSGYGELS